jgi:hypothetical protein
MERDTEINYLMGIHHNILESKKLQEKILRTIKIDIQIGVSAIMICALLITARLFNFI